MIRFSKKVEYGVTSLLHLARLGPGGRVSTRELAELFHIPAEHLGKVLQKMVRAGLLLSTQGAQGGYELTRALTDITVGEVADALDGKPEGYAGPTSHTACGTICTCYVKRGVQSLQELLHRELHELTLDRVAEEEASIHKDHSGEAS